MPKLKPLAQRLFLSNDSVQDVKERLNQLCDSCKLDRSMGELLLSELRLSKNPSDDKLKERAKILGLI